ncbi:MAG TPA: FliH/SctL family protein [Phycisphaerae bacterium]|nr:FliH/SctL family protein [Phycisphaerae bacterium]
MSRAVIKADEARFASRGMYSLDLRDISRQAADMIATARAEAERLVVEARRQAETLRESIQRAAHREGYEKGLTEGREKGRAEALAQAREQFAKDQASLVTALTGLLEAFKAQREKLYLAARRDVVVLAVTLARRIVARLPELGDAADDAACKACEEALQLVRGATDVVIRTHPDDRTALEHLVDEIKSSMQASRDIHLVEDASVGRGGVVLESADCTIDAKASSRVDRIADELVAGWQRRMKELSLES